MYHLDFSRSTRNSGNKSYASWVTEVETRGWQGRIASINKAVGDSSTISNNASFSVPVPTTITINLEAYVKIGKDINSSALVNELIPRIVTTLCAFLTLLR